MASVCRRRQSTRRSSRHRRRLGPESAQAAYVLIRNISPRSSMLIKPFAIVAMLVACSTALAAEAPASNACLPEAWASHGGSYATASDGVRIWYKLAGRDGAPVIAFLHGGPG